MTGIDVVHLFGAQPFDQHRPVPSRWLKKVAIALDLRVLSHFLSLTIISIEFRLLCLYPKYTDADDLCQPVASSSSNEANHRGDDDRSPQIYNPIIRHGNSFTT